MLGTICAIFGVNLFRFLPYIKDEIYIVLGTASSESVLPRLLEKLPRFGVSKQAAGLVLPTGYAFNLDGTSIYMSMGVMFLANAYGVPLDFGAQLGILGIMLLTSKGAATVTGGSFVVFAATVTSTGVLPVEGLADPVRRLPLHVDRDRDHQRDRQQRRHPDHREALRRVRPSPVQDRLRPQRGGRRRDHPSLTRCRSHRQWRQVRLRNPPPGLLL